MIPTNRAFNGRNSITYEGKLYTRLYEILSRPSSYRLHFEFLSTDSEYEQKIGLTMYLFDGRVRVNGQEVKLGKGKFTGLSFAENSTPKQFDIDIKLNSGSVAVYNDVTNWMVDITFQDKWVMPAMIVEQISETSFIFHCNDRVYDDDFDDLVFKLDILEISDE